MLSDFKVASSESGQWQVQPAGWEDLEGHPRGPRHVPLRAPCLCPAGLDRFSGKCYVDSKDVGSLPGPRRETAAQAG